MGYVNATFVTLLTKIIVRNMLVYVEKWLWDHFEFEGGIVKDESQKYNLQ